MDAKKTLDRIYAMLSGESGEVKLATAKLEDGTTIRAEAFEAGNDVFVVTEEEEIPAPVGEHTLEGGNILVIEEEGKIAEIKEPEGEDLKYTDKDMEEMKSKVEDLEKRVKMMEKEKEEMAAEKSELQKQKDELEAEKSELSKSKEETEIKLAKVEKEKQELSEASTPSVKHSPEKENERKGYRFAQKRPQNTEDRVLEMLNFNSK